MRAKWTLAAALVVLGLGLGEVRANGCYETDLVQGWYHQFLHRSTDPVGLANWSDALRRGAPTEQVAAGILGSEEYYLKHNACPRDFVAGLYADVLGRGAGAQEINSWLRRLGQVNSRAELARDFIVAAQTELAHRTARPMVEQVHRRVPGATISYRHVRPRW